MAAQDPTGDWWDDNAPPAAAAGGFTPDPGHGAPVAPGSPPLSSTPGVSSDPSNPTYDPKDATYIGRQIAAYAQAHKNDPGFDQSLINDPNYWIQRIQQTGGWQGDNAKWWSDTGFHASQGGGSGGSTGAPLPVTPYGGIGSTPSPYINPTWTGGPAPAAPTLSQFTAPTEAELEASPGYQSRLAAGLQAKNRSAAAQGSVLSGGTQQALAQYGQDYASNEYANLFGQSLATNQTNNNVTQGNFGNAFQTYQANYGQFTDAASRGLNAYQTNVTAQRNAGLDYWNELNDLYQTGAGAAAGSYKPSNVP